MVTGAIEGEETTGEVELPQTGVFGVVVTVDPVILAEDGLDMCDVLNVGEEGAEPTAAGEVNDFFGEAGRVDDPGFVAAALLAKKGESDTLEVEEEYTGGCFAVEVVEGAGETAVPLPNLAEMFWVDFALAEALAML